MDQLTEMLKYYVSSHLLKYNYKSRLTNELKLIVDYGYSEVFL